MADNTKRRLDINQVVPGMVTAEDVLTPKGSMLIPSQTVLDEKHLFRIKLYQIPSIVVSLSQKRIELLEQAHILNKSSHEKKLQKSQTFSMFKDNYLSRQNLTRNSLYSIKEGKPIDLDELFDISDSLLGSLRTRSELFNYLYHLRNEEDYTYTHCLNVSVLANTFGQWLHLEPSEIRTLTIAGLLHDIGKLKVDPSILDKPGNLTENEFETIKLHTRLGYQMLEHLDISPEIKNAVLLHHEKIDGSGYPLGLKDDKIPFFAKIISIIDIYDAMTSRRPYHGKYCPFAVIRIFEEESFGLLDTDLLFVFLQNIAHNYLGKDVRLSNGKKGRIVFIHKHAPSYPMIQINNEIIDLLNEPGLVIQEIL